MAIVQKRPVLVQPENPVIRHIALTQGQIAIVDIDRYDELMSVSWFAAWAKGTQSFYAVSSVRGKRTYMHRLLAGDRDGYLIDHRSGNTLDNRVENLRHVTYSENNRNRKTKTTNSSGIIGITWSKASRKWRVGITVNGKYRHVGRYVLLQEAIAARNAACAEHYGDFWRHHPV